MILFPKRKVQVTEWTIETLKSHFDALLAERINTIRETHHSFNEAIEKLESKINDMPGNYAHKAEVDVLQTEINAIKSDHVQRREFNEIKDEHSQGRGVRLAAAAGLGIVISLITVTLGVMYANQLDNKDISVQIEREAPWLKDKTEIQEDIHRLEQQIILLKTQLASHEATDRVRFGNR